MSNLYITFDRFYFYLQDNVNFEICWFEKNISFNVFVKKQIISMCLAQYVDSLSTRKHQQNNKQTNEQQT